MRMIASEARRPRPTLSRGVLRSSKHVALLLPFSSRAPLQSAGAWTYRHSAVRPDEREIRDLMLRLARDSTRGVMKGLPVS